MTEPLIVDTSAVLNNGQFGQLPLVANFLYTPSDPMAVTMTLILDVELTCGHVASAQTSWVYARELLDKAMGGTGTVGEGDVLITYLGMSDTLKISLTDVHDEKHDLFVQAGPVAEFLERSLRMMPAHAESVDVDGAIAQILDAAGGR